MKNIKLIFFDVGSTLVDEILAYKNRMKSITKAANVTYEYVYGTAKWLEEHGILKYIDLVVASAEEGIAKPDKRIFEIGLSRAGCAPGQSVMIGDRIDNDIVPANRLGMNTIWIRQGYWKYWNVTNKEEIAGYVVNNLSGICNII